jgi:hypothetical protein
MDEGFAPQIDPINLLKGVNGQLGVYPQKVIIKRKGGLTR